MGMLHKLLGLPESDVDAFRQRLRQLESDGSGGYGAVGGMNNHYDGAYQMGAAAKQDAAQLLGMPVPSRQEFRSNPALQEQFVDAFARKNHEYLGDQDWYNNLQPREKLQYLARAHSAGAGGVKKAVRTGVDARDGFGTPSLEYAQINFDEPLDERTRFDQLRLSQTPEMIDPEVPPEIAPEVEAGFVGGDEFAQPPVAATGPLNLAGPQPPEVPQAAAPQQPPADYGRREALISDYFDRRESEVGDRLLGSAAAPTRAFGAGLFQAATGARMPLEAATMNDRRDKIAKGVIASEKDRALQAYSAMVANDIPPEKAQIIAMSGDADLIASALGVGNEAKNAFSTTNYEVWKTPDGRMIRVQAGKLGNAAITDYRTNERLDAIPPDARQIPNKVYKTDQGTFILPDLDQDPFASKGPRTDLPVVEPDVAAGVDAVDSDPNSGQQLPPDAPAYGPGTYPPLEDEAENPYDALAVDEEPPAAAPANEASAPKLPLGTRRYEPMRLSGPDESEVPAFDPQGLPPSLEATRESGGIANQETPPLGPKVMPDGSMFIENDGAHKERAKTQYEYQRDEMKYYNAFQGIRRKLDNRIKRIERLLTPDMWDKFKDSSGLYGQVTEKIRGSDANKIKGILDGIASEIGFGELASMRSDPGNKTGGGVGALSERELHLLSQLQGALNPGDPETTEMTLQQILDNLYEIRKEHENEFGHKFGYNPKGFGSNYDPKRSRRRKFRGM